jgi:hypothetical protein
MPYDVCHHLEQRTERPPQRSGAHLRRVHRRSGGKGSAQVGDLIGDLQRGPRGGPLVEHCGGEVCEPGFVRRVGVAAGLDHEAGRHDRQTRRSLSSTVKPFAS